MTRIILNKTKNHDERYYLIDGHLGSYNEPPESPNHKFSIGQGVRGDGHHSYWSVSHVLTNRNIPAEVRANLIRELRKLGYDVN